MNDWIHTGETLMFYLVNEGAELIVEGANDMLE